jgi:hypothetical protein
MGLDEEAAGLAVGDPQIHKERAIRAMQDKPCILRLSGKSILFGQSINNDTTAQLR